MITGHDIEYLIWTYELPKSTGIRVRDIVVKEFETIGFPSFKHLYNRVAYLIEAFTNHYYTFDPISNDSTKNPLANKLYQSRPNIEDKLTTDDENKIDMYEAINYIRSQLDFAQNSALDILIKQINNSDISSDKLILAPLESIKERLDKIIKSYEKDGQILIPKRPIIEIKWNSEFWVKFGNRKYNGNPLQFFYENLDVYNKFKTGTEFRKFDIGLHTALYKHKQGRQAISTLKILRDKLIKLNNAKIIEIFSNYYKSDKNIGNIANISGVSREKVSQLLHRADLELLKCGKELSEKDIKEIYDAYFKFNGNASEASRHLPYSDSTILNHWKINNQNDIKFEIKKRGNPLNENAKKEINEAYSKFNGNSRKAAKCLPYARSTILKYWKEIKPMSKENST